MMFTQIMKREGQNFSVWQLSARSGGAARRALTNATGEFGPATVVIGERAASSAIGPRGPVGGAGSARDRAQLPVQRDEAAH